MNLPGRILGWCAVLGLGTSQALAGPIAIDDDDAYPVRSDLTISYFPSTVPPDPIFQGSQLSGTARFYEYALTGENRSFIPLVPPDPIDIGHLAAGDAFSLTFIPGDPCFMARTCGLAFSFEGLAGNFAADAFAPGNQLSSIIPVGSLPSSLSGMIFATDANFGMSAVGTWDVTLRETAVPEPGTLALFAGGAGLMLLLPTRRKRSRAVQ
ncbi:MAG TPA: PEP-CTERM sorting domain-containing protein [Povalibacter sp.]|nr:PEP-CTERM sorting domain-containing protein [Povalibacter sp.]